MLDLAVLARALNEFESHYNQVAEPFDWQFTREDLLQRLSAREPQVRLAA